MGQWRMNADAQTVCFISSKGGSGKTVTSSALGTFLARLGFDVLLVDTDAATNGLTLLFLDALLGSRKQREPELSQRYGLFDGVTGDRIDFLLIDENLSLLPATYSMARTEDFPLDVYGPRLASVLRENSFDFVFLDAQAGTDSFAKMAVEASDRAVVVSEYDPVSAAGIERLKQIFSDVLSPRTTWTLFNKILPEFASAIGDGLAVAQYLPPVPWDADVVRAFVNRDLAIEFNAPNTYTLAIAQIALSMFPDEVGDKIDEWRGVALESALAPTKSRLDELEALTRSLEAERTKLSDRSSMIRLLSSTLLSVPIYIGVILVISRLNDLNSLSYVLTDPTLLILSLAYLSAYSFVSRYLDNLTLSRFKARFEHLDSLISDAKQERSKLRSISETTLATMLPVSSGPYATRRRQETRIRRMKRASSQ